MKAKNAFERAVQELAAPESRRPASGTRPRLRPPSGAFVAAKDPAPSQRYAALRQALTRYLSPILVDSVLQRALAARGGSAVSLEGAALTELAGDIMLGLRLFVPEQSLSALMLELAEILDDSAP